MQAHIDTHKITSIGIKQVLLCGVMCVKVREKRCGACCTFVRVLGLELGAPGLLRCPHLLTHFTSPELLIFKKAIAHYGLSNFSSDFFQQTPIVILWLSLLDRTLPPWVK